ncbi:hypothetical protein [Saccharibacillus kuerlensis]|uniref:Uncharacterized protein n=1 Tax=Saccharibacillus kuerlensis TaxID=459527 RepID=A0ABQ2KYP6_9BACL|nr:hypothetical protein [Saccharibacillus kuerlensis]GGN95416.1 hypothetical protein GCM10010969_11180 [Saccharibacillus kuerlensis]
MQNNQTIPQFSDVLEEVNFILYGSKSGKSDEERGNEHEEQAEAYAR